MGNCLKSDGNDGVSLINNDGSANNNFNNIEERGIPPNSNQSEMIQPSAILHSTSSVRTITLTEDEQIKITKRLALIQHLPIGKYKDSNVSECVICMINFCKDDNVRYLPCMHIYHEKCIDDWLMRSFTCPSCMEPVDAALFNIYET